MAFKALFGKVEGRLGESIILNIFPSFHSFNRPALSTLWKCDGENYQTELVGCEYTGTQCSVSHGHCPNLEGWSGSKVPLMILYRVRCPWGQKTLVTRCPWSFCTRYGAPENIGLQFLPKICSMGPILLFMADLESEFRALSIQTL